MTRLVADDSDEAYTAHFNHERVRGLLVVEPSVLPPGGIVLVPYDEQWPVTFGRIAAMIRWVLGDGALQIEHVGSTSVPGLSAKPIIDVALAVADPTNEPAYVPQLESAGFVFRVREPDWHQHRLFRLENPACNLHVFAKGSPEIERYLLFRDRLRSVEEERTAYDRKKEALAQRPWRYMQQYADAKSDIVEGVIERARQAR